MDTLSIEEINANEIINILGNIIQKYIIKAKEEKGDNENENK